MSIKVFCTAPINRYLKYLEIPSNINLKVNEYATGQDLMSGINWCNRHISNARIKLSNELFEQGSCVDKIYQPSVGFDNIEIDISKFDINISGLWNEVEFRKSNLSTAEHTLSLILAHLKNLIKLVDDVKSSGRWDNRSYHIKDLCDQKVGIVGFGCVGQGLAHLVRAFRSNILVYDPYIDTSNFINQSVRFVDYYTLLQSCDLISFHTPLNEETKNMFNQDHIEKCSKKPLIVNCARGGIVNESDIIKGLNSETISGYVTDVLEHENPLGVNGNKLVESSYKDQRILITPHVGGSSFNYMKKIFQLALDRISND